MKPRKSQHPLNKLIGRSLVIVALTLAGTGGAFATHRIYLSPEGELPSVEITGSTEIIVTLSRQPATVTLTVDGTQVEKKSFAPYVFSVDFGSEAVEHKLSVSVRSGDSRVQWSRVINRGHQPLGIQLESMDGGGFRAITTSPDHDPVTEVSFYAGDRLLGKFDRPPYVISEVTPTDASLIFVTAKSRSGSEVADTFSLTDDVLAETYDVRTVPLFVTVTDEKGSALDSLNRDDFKVYDKGKPARILEFGKAFNQPISLALVIDASGSMLYTLPHALSAAQKFAGAVLRDGDRAALFTIHSVPRRDVALTSDLSQLRAAMNGVIQPSGETALFDAISTALRELRDEKGRRAVVVLTDGNDTASNRTFDELAGEAREAGIPIYSIAYEGHDAEVQRAIDQLRYLATSTGSFVASATKDNLEKRYETIARDLRAQYAIRYQIADSSRAREWRPIKIVLNSPRYLVRTIAGYFTP